MTKVFSRSIAIKLIGAFRGVAVPQINHFLVNGDVCNPPFTLLAPRNAFESAGIVSFDLLIAAVLGMRAFAKVLLSIVQGPFCGNMIHFNTVAFDTTHDFPVHQDRIPSFSSIAACALSIVFSGLFNQHGVPSVLIKVFIIFGVNDGNLSIKKKDFTVGFKEWEGHARSFKRVGFAGCDQHLTLPLYQ